eukprot:s5010_g1.t1
MAAVPQVFAEVFCRSAGSTAETRLALTPGKVELVVGRDKSCDYQVSNSKAGWSLNAFSWWLLEIRDVQ